MPGRGKGKAKKRRKVSGEVTEDPDDPETFFVRGFSFVSVCQTVCVNVCMRVVCLCVCIE